jgi:hypothetical protein
MMRSGRTFIRLGMAAMLGVAWLAAADAAQAPRPGTKNATPERQPRDRATPVWTDHLKVTTYPGDAAVAPGRRTTLVLEIQPGDGMHVYAPGADGYKVIALALTPQPFVRVVPLEYPASEIYYFKPLDERVPVYRTPFTLRQELVLDDRPEARAAFRGKASLTVAGSLSYQACDDRICFNPVTGPLSWTLPLGPAAGRQ